jgi:hypothetical protein
LKDINFYFADNTKKLRELNNIGVSIADEILNQNYQYFNYNLKEDQIRKYYKNTIESDTFAKSLVEFGQKELNLVLTGSLALRKAGTVYRTADETIHDIDWVVPYELNSSPQNQEVYNDIVNNEYAAIRDSYIEGLKIDDVSKNTLTHIQRLDWFSKFKDRYPSFEFVQGFYGGEHTKKESFTAQGVIDGQFYEEDGYHTEQYSFYKKDPKTKKPVKTTVSRKVKHRKGEWVKETGYVVDFFVRLQPKQEEHENYFKLWKEIMIAKLKMGRDKDFIDWKAFVPYVKSKDSYNFNYEGYRHINWSETNQNNAFEQEVSPFKEELREENVNLEEKMSLFPETNQDVFLPVKASTKLTNLLEELSSRFSIPYQIIDDPNQKFKGKYVNKGKEKIVVINVAYATEDTPLHEYYHPFVSTLMQTSPQTFEILYKESYVNNGIEDREESVVQYLGEQAISNKYNLYLKYFLNYIRNFLGLKNSLTATSTLIEVLNTFERGMTISDNVIRTAYQRLDEAEEAVANGLGAKKKPKIDYINELEKQAQGWSSFDNSVYYENISTGEKAKRITSFVGDVEVGEFSSKQKRYSNSDAEYEAKKVFARNGVNIYDKNEDEIKETITIQGERLTFQDVYRTIEARLNEFKNKGKLIHAYFQYVLEQNPQKKEEAKQNAIKYAKATKADFISLESHPSIKRIKNNLDKIFEAAGVIVDLDNTLPPGLRDKVSSEGVIVSDLMVDKDGNKLATTYDGLFVHQNGEATFVDFKTGWLTRDSNTNQMIKYGEEFGINDSRLSRAYLEKALRTVMLKEKFPDLKFRSIKLLVIDAMGNPTAMELDLEPYLFTIQNYYKTNHPKIHDEMEKKGLFKLSNYKGVTQSLIDLHSEISHLSRDEKLIYLKNKLSDLYLRSSKEQVERDPRKKALSIKYSQAILEIEKEPTIDLKSKTPDLGFFWKIKNFSDVDNPRIQVLHKVLLEAKQRLNIFSKNLEENHDNLFLKLVNERVGPNDKMNKAALKGLEMVHFASMATWNPILAAGVVAAHNAIASKTQMDTRDFYAFMWRKSDEIGGTGYYLNTKNTYVKNGKEVPMTKAEQDYRNYVHKTMKEEYNKFAKEIVGFDEVTRQPIYRYSSLGLPEEMPLDFMPRIPKSINEIREEEIKTSGYGAGLMGLKTTVGEEFKRSLNGFFEDKYGRGSEGIQFRYFKHTDSPGIVDAENHSFNGQIAFKMFMMSMKTKQEMDPLYDLARGVRNALDEELMESGEEARYSNTVQWLDDEIYTQILGRQKTEKVLTRAVRWKAGKLTEKVTGIKEGTDVRISEIEIVRWLRTSVSFLTLGFKVISPIRNGIYVTLQTISQSTKNIVTKGLSKIYGVDVEELGQIDLVGGKIVFNDYIAKAIMGKPEESKLWNIAKAINWLPDNYVISDEDIKKMEAVSKIGLGENAYAAYSLFENFSSLWHLAGLLKSTKVLDKDGNKISLWDAHDDKGGWNMGVRGVVENSDGTTTELKELTAMEIKALKRTHERVSGSYRKDEKIAMEASVWGDFLAQFQKHAFQYVKVLFGSKYRDRSIGKYVLVGKKPDGMPMYEWHSEILQGQIKIFFAALFAAIQGKHMDYMTGGDLGEATLKNARIRAMSSLINTLIWWLTMLAIYSWAFDDEEEKTPLGKSAARIVTDMSRFLSLKDILDATDKPVVSLEVANKIGKSTWALLTEGMAGEVDRQGWPKGLRGFLTLTPGYSSRSQIEQILGNDEDPSFLYGIYPLK